MPGHGNSGPEDIHTPSWHRPGESKHHAMAQDDTGRAGDFSRAGGDAAHNGVHASAAHPPRPGIHRFLLRCSRGHDGIGAA
eukprot:1040820-Pyramimonas_sp.AAC.1